MVQNCCYLFFTLLIVLPQSFSERRIKDGLEVTTDKRYAVYLLKADTSPTKYQGWLCGGAILTEDFIVTSAACVQDVQHLYVISGYNKYVPSDKMLEDECVKNMRKKVILTCVPRDYQFDYNQTELWAKADIAVIKVESAFNFTDDANYKRHNCSYAPEPIDYNTEQDFPKPGDDVVALGWGHDKMFRKDLELIDLNQAKLHYAAIRVLDITECLEQYKGNENLVRFIATSMICTLGIGNLNDNGDLLVRTGPDDLPRGCIPEEMRKRGVIGPLCKENYRTNDMMYDDMYGEEESEGSIDKAVRKIINETRRSHGNYTRNIRRQYGARMKMYFRTTEDPKIDKFDTPGICQNDHGGPLIAWRGGQEVLVAVATLYRLDSNLFCQGPYLFTKTWCNGQFINCVINPDKAGSGRRCDDPEDIGFEIVRRHISWAGHKDGPADNERIQIRHQMPMSVFQPKNQTPRPH